MALTERVLELLAKSEYVGTDENTDAFDVDNIDSI